MTISQYTSVGERLFLDTRCLNFGRKKRSKRQGHSFKAYSGKLRKPAVERNCYRYISKNNI